MARAAAATALLNRELKSLSQSGSSVSRPTQTISKDTDQLAKDANKASSSINLLATAALTLGPALVPIGAVAVPAIAGLANQLGVAAIAGGTAMLAFQGVGDALKAVDTAALEPTTANLLKAQQAMAELSPAAATFVRHLHDLGPVLEQVRGSAAQGLFPGLDEALNTLQTRVPDVERLLSGVSTTLGHLAAAGAKDLASSHWDNFFHFLANDAPATLKAIGQTVGDLAHGLAQIWIAFSPLEHGFNDWLLSVAQSFDRWATGLSATQGFADFLNYIRTNGPIVASAMQALANAVVQIVEAMAPLGGPILQGLTAVLDVIANIANSDFGTPILAAVAATRLLAAATFAYGKIAENSFAARQINNVKSMSTALTTVTTAQDRARMSAADLTAMEEKRSATVRAGLATIGKSVATVGALGLIASGAADKIGLTNTASLALLGTWGGPWGIAAGAAAGSVMDLAHANDSLDAATVRANQAIASGSIPAMQSARAEALGLVAAFNQMNDNKGGLFSVLNAGLHLPSTEFKLLSGSIDNTQAAADRLTQAILNAKYGSRDLTNVLGGTLLQNLGFTSQGLKEAGDSATQFTQQLDRANNVLTKRSSLRSYQQALDDFRTALQQNGKSMDITTTKGRNVQAALDNIASTALQAAQNLGPLQRARYLDGARKDFINAAMELGKTRDQAQQLADRLGLLNGIKAQPKVQLQGMVQLNQNLDELNAHFNAIDHLMGGPTVKVSGVQTGISLIDNLLHSLQAVNGYTATTNVVTHYSKTYGGQAGGGGHAAPGLTYADGGVLDFYAGGGLRRENHVAQIAPAGAWRVWAEPETQGEAYIPLADDWRRARAQDIWRETGKRLGMHFMEYARGAIVTSAGRPAPSSVGGAIRIDGPVAIRGRIDIATGDLVGVLEGPMRAVARQEIDDTADYNRTMAGRR